MIRSLSFLSFPYLTSVAYFKNYYFIWCPVTRSLPASLRVFREYRFQRHIETSGQRASVTDFIITVNCVVHCGRVSFSLMKDVFEKFE